MANTKISQLTPNTNPNGGEELVYAYNGTNGKMTLNTMKGYVENNLSGYVTDADLADDLAAKQDTLVSGTNIKTINGSSILGSGNLVISGGGGSGEDNDYDAVVDANGGGDYTSISDAITAGIKRMYVRNGNYSMSAQTLSTGDFKLVGESKQGVHIDIIHPTRSSSIFNMTSNTTDLTHSFLISNVTFNITYTGEYGYFVLFDIPDKGFLTLDNCNICVISAENGCNFYLCDTSGQANVNSCYIEIYPATGNPQGLGFLGINNNSTCEDSIIVVDAAQALSISEFNCTPSGTYAGCKFLVGKTHDTAGDVAMIGCSTGIMCSYETSANANQKIYGHQIKSSFSQTGTGLTYDSNLNTAVTSKKITIWEPSTAYAVGDYVMSGNSQTLARCKTAHTSGATFDATKFDDVYGDTYIVGNYDSCTFSIWGTTIIAGIATYVNTVVQPASMGNIHDCQFSCYTSSSAQPNYCNIVVLSHRGFVNNRILNRKKTVPMHLYLGGECSVFTGNRIMSASGDIYSGGYGNIITNNVFTYITGQTIPTITQVTSGASEIANNVIRGVADWDN